MDSSVSNVALLCRAGAAPVAGGVVRDAGGWCAGGLAAAHVGGARAHGLRHRAPHLLRRARAHALGPRDAHRKSQVILIS